VIAGAGTAHMFPAEPIAWPSGWIPEKTAISVTRMPSCLNRGQFVPNQLLAEGDVVPARYGPASGGDHELPSAGMPVYGDACWQPGCGSHEASELQAQSEGDTVAHWWVAVTLAACRKQSSR
jgi:hypothetical protein